MQRRHFLTAAGTTAGGIGLAGCSGQSDGGGGNGGGDGSSPATDAPNTETPMATPTASEPSMTEVQMGASFYPTVISGHLPIQMARGAGLFEENGISVTEVISFSGGGATIRGILTADVIYGVPSLAALIKAYLAGGPISLVGLVHKATAIDFHTLPDSDIETIHDLAGGSIALSNPGSSSEAVTIASILNTDGLTLDDVEFVYAGGLGESLTLLNEGRVDVTWNIAPNSIAMIAQEKSRRVWHGKDTTDITQGVSGMSTRAIDEDPETARAVLNGIRAGMDFMKNNLERSAEIWANNADLPVEITTQALQDLNPTDAYTLRPDEDILKRTAEIMIEQGEIEEQPPWEEIIRQEPLPEDLRVDWV